MGNFTFSKSITIGNKSIGLNNPIYFIAEIGVNHNGDMNLAFEMMKEAKKAGAHAVKFQTFKAETLVCKDTPKVNYQKGTTSADETHYDMIKKLELSHENHYLLMDYCKQLDLEFMSTPYDIDSAIFLKKIGVRSYKTASADLVDLPLQKWIAETGKPSIVSVGMATLGEIEKVLEIYRKANNPNLILLHCVSNYPASDESLNLRVMSNLENTFDILIGYSDHSIGSVASILSIAYGAKLIEKHFTLDKNLPGPDHKASSTPAELNELVESVNRAKKMQGSPIKQCQEEERQMSQVSRKSIVLAKDIEKGEVFSEKHLIMKRPGTGLKSEFLEYFLGKKASKTIKTDTILKLNDIES